MLGYYPTGAAPIGYSGASVQTQPTTPQDPIPPTQPAADPRYARPASDVSKGPWSASASSTLAGAINEPSADAADYITATTPGACEIKLGAVADPGTSSGQVVRYQAWSDSGGALLVQLKQGATIIAAWNHASLPTTPTVFAQALSPSQCDSITDYSDLRFAFTAG